MENRPAVWNGTEVPYGEDVAELAKRIHGPAPARWAAFVALAHAPGPSALAVLKDSLGSPDAHVRRIAVEAIGVHAEGMSLGTAVRSLLSDRDPIVVREACEAAGRQHLRDAHDSVARLLNAEDAPTRAAAVRALRELWREADFERVLRAFTSDASDGVRKEAAWTLRSVVSAANWRVLFGLWQVDPLPRHRGWACEMAVEFGGREVLPALQQLAADVDGHVRDRAAQALRDLEARGLTSG